MNTRSIPALALFAAVAFSSASAMAQEITPDNLLQPRASTTTRADVLAQLQQARLDGSIRAGEEGHVAPFQSTRTRAEVRAETIAAMRDGRIALINDEAFAFEQQPATGAAPMRTAAY